MKRNESPPRMFFVYSHPCGDVLVKRGTITQKELNNARSHLRAKKISTRDAEVFGKAFSRVKEYAKKKRAKLDAKTVSRYFLTQHNRVVKIVSKKARDVKPRQCFITPGWVSMAKGRKGRVSTPFGYRNINIEFVPNLKIGDLVAVHYNYACEKISLEDFKRLWREVESYD